MNPSRSLGLDKLFSSSAIYFLSGVGQQAVGFLLLPLYTNVLSPSDYGVLEILNTTGLILLMVLNLGLPSAIMKCYHRDCASDAERRAVFTTSLAVGLPVLIAGCLLLFLRADWLTVVLLGRDGTVRLVRLMVVWVFLTGLSGILQALFRAREEAALLGSLTLGTFTLLMFLNVYFVWALKLGVQGVLLGNCLSTAAAVIGAALMLKGRAAPRVELALIRPLVGFGVLVVPAALSGWIINVADRYFLRYFGQLSVVGIYSLGYKLGMVMDVVIVAPFQLAWPPFSFGISADDGHPRIYARTLTYLVLVSCTAVLGLTLLAPVVLRYATHPDYFEAYAIVPLISLAYAFNGVHYCVSPGIHLRRQTRFLPAIVVAAAAVNVVLCLVLIPKFGMMGAAWATTLAFAVLALATFGVSQVVYPIDYEYRRLAKITMSAVIIYLVSVWVPIAHPLAKGVASVAILALGYPALLLASGVLEPDERATLGRWLRQLRIRRPLSAVGATIRQPAAKVPDISVRSDVNV